MFRAERDDLPHSTELSPDLAITRSAIEFTFQLVRGRPSVHEQHPVKALQNTVATHGGCHGRCQPNRRFRGVVPIRSHARSGLSSDPHRPPWSWAIMDPGPPLGSSANSIGFALVKQLLKTKTLLRWSGPATGVGGHRLRP